MNREIESKWYISSENETVWFRYYVDDKTKWYCFDDLYKILNLDGREAYTTYKKINQFSKEIFIDKNADNGRSKPVRYINEFGIKEIEQHVCEKFGMLYKDINILNGQIDDNKIEQEKEIMKEYVVHAIDKGALIDLHVDESKMDFIIDYELDNVNRPVMKKKPNCPTDEERVVLYKKNKGKSSCPSWLKEIVK